MNKLKKILIINGSASQNSSNSKIVNFIVTNLKDNYTITVIDNLKVYPHFDTAYTTNETPNIITELRQKIKDSNGIIICSPEYIFSIPSGLKNIFEWCVSTTVLAKKKLGLIIASANGEKAMDELKLICSTLELNYIEDTTLLIKAVKGKIDHTGKIKDILTLNELDKFINSYKKLIE